PCWRKISGIGFASRATILSSVSTKQRPRRRASSRPTDDFPAPMKPTRITLSAGIPPSYQIARFRDPRAGWRAHPDPRGLPVHGMTGGDAAVGAVAHPAARALAEVVVHARGRTRAGQERDGLHGCHEAGRVQADGDRVGRAQPEQLALLGHVPVAVARADPVGDLEAARDPLLTEDVVHVLREALDGARADAVEHRGERELASLPELGDAPLEAIADRAQRGDDVLDRSPALSDLRNPERHATGLEKVSVLAGDGEPAHDGARFHQRAPEGERLVEEPPHLGAGEVRVALVALEAQDLGGVDLEGDVREDAGLGRGVLARHAPRRPAARTTAAMRSMCSGFEPQQAPTMLQPASSSAGYSRAISSGPSSYVTVSPFVTGRPALG